MRSKLPLYVLVLFLLPCCEHGSRSVKGQEVHIQGETMGTFYSVVIAVRNQRIALSPQKLKEKIDLRLERINDIFSTYRINSAISQFNRSQNSMEVPNELAFVVTRSLKFSKLTYGAFNIALDPLIGLWGFDRNGRIDKKPSDAAIAKALTLSNISHLRVQKSVLKKADPRLSINLSGVAKGWAVDDLARLLISMGINDFLLEIGGEMVAKGFNMWNKPWLVGIENPEFIGDKTRLLARVHLENQALATSGTYLNFFVENGVTYSHIIDPRTGYPVKRELISITVIAPDCMTADALATAGMVLGEERTREIIKNFPHVSMMFVKEQEGKLIKTFAENFVEAR